MESAWDAEPVHGLERLALGQAGARTKFLERVPAPRVHSIRELVHAVAGLRERVRRLIALARKDHYRLNRIGLVCHSVNNE